MRSRTSGTQVCEIGNPQTALRLSGVIEIQPLRGCSFFLFYSFFGGCGTQVCEIGSPQTALRLSGVIEIQPLRGCLINFSLLLWKVGDNLLQREFQKGLPFFVAFRFDRYDRGDGLDSYFGD